MKRFLSIFAVLFLAVVIVGCKPKTYEVALVTDVGTISDQSFNQAAWTGVKKYGDEFGKTYQYYQPTCTGANCVVQDSDRERSINRAVEGGAKVIVLPGFLFGSIIDKVAEANPTVKFVGIDVAPQEAQPNVLGIYFRDYEAGFVAGYSAVKEGYTKLGYMGGQPVPAVKQYGTGFVAGALYAADEDEVADFTFADNRYLYLNSFMPDASHKTAATTWYTEGTQVIFAAAGGAGLSVHEAAQAAQKQFIGVDVDQSYLSQYVLTSAMKNMALAVYNTLVNYKNGTFESGTVTKGVREQGSGIAPWDKSHFTNFTQAEHDALIAKITDGTVDVPATWDELKTFATGLGYTEAAYPAKETVEPTVQG